MLGGNYTPEGYVKDGLVLWMDGLNRGGVAGEWHDLIDPENICTLTGNYTELDNGVSLPGDSSTYGTFAKTVYVSYTQGTIECALTLTAVETTGRPLIAMGNRAMGGSFASAYSDGNNPAMRWWNYGDNWNYWVFPHVNSNESLKYTASASSENGVCNGTNGELNTVSSWSPYAYPRLGSRGSGNPFKGTFYAIRLYNRHLTQAEMLHNQRIDNKRYNLGLTI